MQHSNKSYISSIMLLPNQTDLTGTIGGDESSEFRKIDLNWT
jgi:hypothetical protein